MGISGKSAIVVGPLRALASESRLHSRKPALSSSWLVEEAVHDHSLARANNRVPCEARCDARALIPDGRPNAISASATSLATTPMAGTQTIDVPASDRNCVIGVDFWGIKHVSRMRS